MRRPAARRGIVLSLALGASGAGGLAADAAGAPPAASAASAAPIVITDLAHWHHPTKAVFARNGVTLLKVTIVDRRPTFVVAFPYDPRTHPNDPLVAKLCLELLRANGRWPYSLAAPDDGVAFDIRALPGGGYSEEMRAIDTDGRAR